MSSNHARHAVVTWYVHNHVMLQAGYRLESNLLPLRYQDIYYRYYPKDKNVHYVSWGIVINRGEQSPHMIYDMLPPDVREQFLYDLVLASIK